MTFQSQCLYSIVTESPESPLDIRIPGEPPRRVSYGHTEGRSKKTLDLGGHRAMHLIFEVLPHASRLNTVFFC